MEELKEYELQRNKSETDMFQIFYFVRVQLHFYIELLTLFLFSSNLISFTIFMAFNSTAVADQICQHSLWTVIAVYSVFV